MVYFSKAGKAVQSRGLVEARGKSRELHATIKDFQEKLEATESKLEATENKLKGMAALTEAIQEDIDRKREEIAVLKMQVESNTTELGMKELQQLVADRLFDLKKVGGSLLVPSELQIRHQRWMISDGKISPRKLVEVQNHFWYTWFGTEPPVPFPRREAAVTQSIGLTTYETSLLKTILKPGTPIAVMLDSSLCKGKHLLPIIVSFYDHEAETPRMCIVGVEDIVCTSAEEHLRAIHKHIGKQ
jgi:hypothetical protein